MFNKNSPKRALLRAVLVALIGYTLIFALSATWIRYSVIASFKEHEIEVAREAVREINKYLRDSGLDISSFGAKSPTKFDRVIKAKTYGLGISKLRLFDINAHLVYSSRMETEDNVTIFDRAIIQKALTGESQEEISGQESPTMEFEYYAPLFDRNERIIGVAEVYFDLWSMTQNISAATKNVLILSVISFGLFTVVLFVYSLGLFRKMETAREAQIKSERRALELQDMARVGLFISGLAHQLKNPIAILLGLVNALKKRESLPPQKEFIEGLDAETVRMSNLVDNFLRFARPIDKMTVKSATTLKEVVEKVLVGVKKEYPAFYFVNEIGHSRSVEIDHELLFEVLDIVVRNSVNALDKVSNPKVVISCREDLEQATVIITDNGKGLSQELQKSPDLAFQPFFSTSAGGHGLGLALAKRIVEEFGGSISLRSGLDAGAIVEIVLRLAK